MLLNPIDTGPAEGSETSQKPVRNPSETGQTQPPVSLPPSLSLSFSLSFPLCPATRTPTPIPTPTTTTTTTTTPPPPPPTTTTTTKFSRKAMILQRIEYNFCHDSLYNT